MIQIDRMSDLGRLTGKVSPPLFQLIWEWVRERTNGNDYQSSLYSSPMPIGSLGVVLVAETEDDIKGKDFFEITQFILGKETLFICTFLPCDGRECADIFIPHILLSEAYSQQLSEQATQTIRIEERSVTK